MHRIEAHSPSLEKQNKKVSIYKTLYLAYFDVYFYLSFIHLQCQRHGGLFLLPVACVPDLDSAQGVGHRCLELFQVEHAVQAAELVVSFRLA